jgi:hypothetical protein
LHAAKTTAYCERNERFARHNRYLMCTWVAVLAVTGLQVERLKRGQLQKSQYKNINTEYPSMGKIKTHTSFSSSRSFMLVMEFARRSRYCKLNSSASPSIFRILLNDKSSRFSCASCDNPPIAAI